ncbi:hypothetical protein GH5_02516 [Leishmania sp. Ghana 2012 LV757]|uniref:hypothetical protein n=1 Tax=Leishmania sp. Ghana 2012 LV757 TaxID=2803181 RepID=UPI001B6B5E98|nr:hypothetical protein GH5_02516 [Leishmania sp. Ghana 2012 LV757]
MASSTKRNDKTGHRRSSSTSQLREKNHSPLSLDGKSSSVHKVSMSKSAARGAQLSSQHNSASPAAPKPSGRAPAPASNPDTVFATLPNDPARASASTALAVLLAAPSATLAGPPATSCASGASCMLALAGAAAADSPVPISQNAVGTKDYDWMGSTGFDPSSANGIVSVGSKPFAPGVLGCYDMRTSGQNVMDGYGSMGPAGYGSMNSGMPDDYGFMGGTENGMCSMHGMGGPMGSMHGMGGPMSSMYGMGGPMGSMHGMGGPMGSMYGMGGPMGSMYGMGGPMGSMYGMGGPIGSMYGMGGPMGSMYGIGRISGRSSFCSSGGYVGGSFGGLWRAPSGYRSHRKQDFSIPPPSSTLVEEAREERDGPANASKGSGAKAAARAESSPCVAETKTRDVARKKGFDKKEGGNDNAADADADVKDENSRSRGMPTAMASSHRLTKQVNDNVHVIAVVPKESMRGQPDKSVTVGTTPYKMDEVMVAPLIVDRSDLLTDIVEQTQCGHNVSLLALCGAQPYTACTDPITAVVKHMMVLFAEDKKQVTQVKASAVAFAEAGNIVDLLEANAKPVKAEMGSNPIYGPCVMNTSEKDVNSADEAAEIVSRTAAKGAGQGLVVIMFKIKQIRPVAASGAAPTKDVYISSMLVAMVDDASTQYVKVADKHATSGVALIFTNAIGGASRTVAIVQVPEKDAEALVSGAAAHSQHLREIKNTPTRSGNMKRFIDYSERAAAANTKVPPETAAKIERMLKDAKELLARPEQTPLMAYALLNSTSSATPPEREHRSSEPAAKSAGAPAAAAADAAPTATAPKVPAVEKPADTTVAAPAATPSAKPRSEKQVRLVVCVDGTRTMPAEQMKADEVVARANAVDMPASEVLKTLRAAFGSGRNVALLSAETRRSVPLRDQYTWMSVADVLTKAFEPPPGNAKDTLIELFMSVVLKRQVLCDLMADGGASAKPKPLGTATSPLFGPLPFDTTYKTLRQASDVKPALEQALQAAPAYLTEPDAMIVMTAVLKQLQTNNDVLLASFMAVSGPTAAGVCGAMSKNPDYSRSLLSYAIGGPCVTSLLVCVGSDYEASEAAKRSLTDMQALTKQPNHTSRDGSVMAFIDYAQKGLGAHASKLAKAEGEERERIAAALKRLQMMHDDYRAFLRFPAESMPAYYIGDKRVSPAPRTSGDKPEEVASATASTQEKPQRDAGVRSTAPIRTVAVVIDGDDDAGDVANKTPMEVTEKVLIVKGQRYAPTEVVQAKGGSIRSVVVDEMHKIVLNGYNAAMLTSDVGGSTVGISMAVKTVTVIVRDLPKGSEAFWSVTVSKDGKVKDMLADNSPYYDLQMASSPLFGNVPYGASIVPVTEVHVEPTVRAVRNEVREKGGVGYIAVILRIMQPDGDVCVPSFIVAIAGDSVEEYEKALSTRSSSALLSTAIGGACTSIYVAGIRGKSGEVAQPVLELTAKMMRVQNGPLRSGSLKRFISHTEPAVAAMQRKIEASGGAPNPQLLAQVGRIGTMLKDAQSMLNSPGGGAPAVYKR